MKKILASTFLVLIMIFSLCNFSVLAAGKVDVESGNLAINKGSQSSRYISVVNNTGSDITDLFVTIYSEVISAKTSEGTGTISIGNLKSGDSKSLNITFFADNDTPSYNCLVRATMEYKVNGVDAEDSTFFNVTINDSTSNGPAPTPDPNKLAKIILTAPTSVTTIKAGTFKNIPVTFKNSGNTSASNVFLLPEPSKEFTFTVGQDTNSIPTLTAGSSITMNLAVACPKDTKAGTYEVKIRYSYYDSEKKQVSDTATFYVKVENEETVDTPVIVMKDFKISSNKIVADDQFTVSVTVENSSKVAAKNVQVNIGDLSATTIGMTNASGNNYFDSITSKSTKTITYNLKAYEKIKTGSYPVKFKLAYKDTDGKDYTGEYTYYIWVTGKETAKTPTEDKAMLSMGNIATLSRQFDTGEKFPISFNLTNTGKLDAKNIVVTAECPEGIVPNSANKQQILTLKPGESQPLSFTFSPNASSATQSYTIGFTIAYENGLEEEDSEGEKTGVKIKDTFAQYVGVNIVNSKADEEARKKEEEENKDDKNKSIPKIIVSDYKVEPIIVQAGQEFDLYMTFQNTHRIKSVENIKALLTVPVNAEGNKTANVFTPVNSSNTFYIDSINPKGESQQYIRLYTVPDAAAMNYILVIDFEYEDIDGNQIKSQSEVGVNVKQIAKFEVGDIVIPPSAMQGEQLYLEFTVQNAGKVNLNNLKVKLSGEGFDTMGSEYIFGNFASGSYDTYYANYTPTMPGMQTLKVIVSYDDDVGEHFEIVKEFEMDVMPGMDMGMDMGMEEGKFGPDGMMGPDGMPIEQDQGILGFVTTNWIWFTIGGVVLVGAVVGIIIFIRIKKKKELDLDAQL